MWASMQDNVCAPRLSFLSVHLLQYPVLCSQLCTSLCCQVFPFWTLMDIFPSPSTLSSPPCHKYSPATRKLVSVLPDPPGPLLAHRFIAPSLHASPYVSHPTPTEHPLLSSPSPMPLPRHAHSLPSSEAIRKWARSHGCVSKPLGKSWIL